MDPIAPVSLERIAAGDVLLYGGKSFVNLAIQVKTWSAFSHVEVYDGGGYAWASRNGIGPGSGVDRYPVRVDGLLAALRLSPRIPFNLDAARAFWRESQGQAYDWIGLVSFVVASRQGRDNGAQFCSEAAARAIRRGIGAAAGIAEGDRLALKRAGLDPWRGKDADAIAPASFDMSALFVDV